jgi:ferritin
VRFKSNILPQIHSPRKEFRSIGSRYYNSLESEQERSLRIKKLFKKVKRLVKKISIAL